MPPSVRAVSTASHDSGTITVNKPTGTVAGDRLVAIVTRDEGAGTQASGSSLFTKLNESIVASRGRVQVWTRTAGGSEPSTYTFTESSGNSTGTCHLFAIQDVDASAVVVASYANGSSTTATAPSILSSGYVGTDPLLLTGYYCLQTNYATTTYGTPSGMTSRGKAEAPLKYTSVSAFSLGLTGNVATGARASTLSPTRPWIAVSIAIPSTGAPPQDVIPGGIASAEAWGTPTVVPGPVPVGPTTIASAEAWGTPTVTPGPVAVGAGSIASGEAWGTPALQLTVAPAGIASAEDWGTPTVNVGPTVAPSGIESAEAWGTPTVAPGPATVTLAGIDTGEAWGTATVLPLIKPAGIDSAEAWGSPSVIVGGVGLFPAGISSGEAWGTPAVVPGLITTGPSGIPSEEAWGTPRLRLHVVPAGIPSAEAWGNPSVLVGSVTIFPVGIPSAEAWGIPELDVTLDPTITRGILVERSGSRYELVCVARIPSASGPPTFEEVERVALRSLNWSSALSSAQTMSATCAIRSLPEPVLQRLRTPDRLATEFWLNRDGRRVFAGPFVTMRPQGELLTIDALGIYAYTQLMFVTADLPFAQVDQHLIAKALVDHWQEHPTIRHGHYGIDTSAVTASGVLRDRTYVAAEGHQVSRRLQELGAVEGGFDSDVDPTTRRLELWTPQKGVDRSSGSDAIVLDRRNITDPNLMVSVAPGDLASVAIGTSTAPGADAGLWSMAINPELAAAYGAAGVMASWSDISEQGTLDGHVNAMLAARAGALVAPGPRTRVTADADISSYDVGDTVAFDDFVLGLSGAWRIRKRTVDVSESGQETASLEFV